MGASSFSVSSGSSFALLGTTGSDPFSSSISSFMLCALRSSSEAGITAVSAAFRTPTADLPSFIYVTNFTSEYLQQLCEDTAYIGHGLFLTEISIACTEEGECNEYHGIYLLDGLADIGHNSNNAV